MSESQAWAIATQQSHASGNSPKGYGTKEGRKKAKEKYHHKPSSYEQAADPSSKDKSSGIDVSLLKGFSDELSKIAAQVGLGLRTATQLQKRMGTLPKLTAPVSKPITGAFSAPPTGKLAPAKVTVPGLASVASTTQRTPPGTMTGV